MAQTPEQRRANAKRARLHMFYKITPEDEQEVEKFEKETSYAILLTKGDPKEKANLYNDHDHASGLYRGRLAYLINKALGTIEGTYKERTSQILRALACYLDSPPAIHVIGAHYGLIGRAKRKKHMIYGSPSGPLKAQKKAGKR